MSLEHEQSLSEETPKKASHKRLNRKDALALAVQLLAIGGLYSAKEGAELYYANDSLTDEINSEELINSCRPRGLPYQVQLGDSLNRISDKVGLSWGPIGNYLPVLQSLNPALATSVEEINYGLRDPDRLYANHEFEPAEQADTIFLPTTDKVIKFLKDRGQYPFPQAPEDINFTIWQIDPYKFDEYIESIKNRSEAVVSEESTPEAVRDSCIFQIYRLDRELSQENVETVLKEYFYRFESSGYTPFMLKEQLPFYIGQVNRLLKAAGSSRQIDPDFLNLIIFKEDANSLGGGYTNESLRPGIVVMGAYQQINTLTPTSDVDNIFRRTVVHELTHSIQPVYDDNLSESEKNFAHTSIGFITLPTQYWVVDTFNSFSAVDYRVQYLHKTLVQSGLSSQEAYKLIVRASVEKSPSLIRRIRDRYDRQASKNSKEGNPQETFEQLFYKMNHSDFEPSGQLLSYISDISDEYFYDFNILLYTMLELTEEQVNERSTSRKLPRYK